MVAWLNSSPPLFGGGPLLLAEANRAIQEDRPRANVLPSRQDKVKHLICLLYADGDPEKQCPGMVSMVMVMMSSCPWMGSHGPGCPDRVVSPRPG